MRDRTPIPPSRIRYYRHPALRKSLPVRFFAAFGLVFVLVISATGFVVLYMIPAKLVEKARLTFYEMAASMTKPHDSKMLLMEILATSVKYPGDTSENMSVAERKERYDKLLAQCQALGIAKIKIPRFE